MRYRPLISATWSSASLRIWLFSGGTMMSLTDTVTAPRVEYLKPRFLMLSSTWAVSWMPCLR